MNLLFTSPGFLSLLPLATLPVLFHLFFRLKKKPHDVTSLMFFHRIAPRFSARKRIREWLILLLRALLLLLFILALAGPVWRGVGDGDLALALIVDNSASMGAAAKSDNDMARASRIDQARGGASALLDKLRKNDVAMLVPTVDDPALVESGHLLDDREKLSATLARIQVTGASARPARALGRAADRLAESNATRREIHIFTDLQSNDWGRAATELTRLSERTKVVVHHIPAAALETANVALRNLRLPATRLLAGRPIPMRVELANTGEEAVTVNLNTTDRVDHTGTRAVRVGSGASRSVTVITTAPEPGRHWFKAWIGDDSFEGDNIAYVAFEIHAAARVRFLGERRDYGLLPAALAPSAGNLSGLRAEFGPPAEFPGENASNPPVLIVATTDHLAEAREQWPKLETFVEDGGTLLVVAATDGRQGALPPWLRVDFGEASGNEEGFSLVAYAPRHPLFAELLAEDGTADLTDTRVFDFNAIRLPDESTALIGLADGRVVLAETLHGEGRIFTSGLRFTPKATNLVLKPEFLAIGQSLALLSRETPAGTGLVAGAPLRLSGSDDEEALLRVQAFEGAQLDWKGAPADLETLSRPGVYRTEQNGRESWLAVRADPYEGEQDFVQGDRIPILGGTKYQVFQYTGPAAMADYLGDVRPAANLFPWFVLAALLCLLAEGLLANAKRRTTGIYPAQPGPTNRGRTRKQKQTPGRIVR